VKIRICVPMATYNPSDLIPLIERAESEGADLIEIRLDYMEKLEGVEKLVEHTSVPLIATNRQHQEGGSRVPLIVSCKGTTPAGQVSKDLVDFSDFFPTFAELAGAKLPDGVAIDGRSFASQLMGQRGKPRKVYHVTALGRRQIRAHKADWQLLMQLFKEFMGREWVET